MNTNRISLTIGDAELAELEHAAEQNDRSLAAEVRVAIRKHLRAELELREAAEAPAPSPGHSVKVKP